MQDDFIGSEPIHVDRHEIEDSVIDVYGNYDKQPPDGPEDEYDDYDVFIDDNYATTFEKFPIPERIKEFFSLNDEEKEIIAQELAEAELEGCDDGTVLDILIEGCTGYNNMSDIELLSTYLRVFDSDRLKTFKENEHAPSS